MVEVRNLMISESTSIHWHGIDQKGTPYMDGVPYVTQCPILPNDRFRYEFTATRSGTYFWHSHIGMYITQKCLLHLYIIFNNSHRWFVTGSQRADGLFGALIVRDPPKSNHHLKLYDYDEHTMMVNDWMHLESDVGFVRDFHYRSNIAPNAMIVNGRGRFQPFVDQNGSVFYTPFEVFTVTRVRILFYTLRIM